MLLAVVVLASVLAPLLAAQRSGEADPSAVASPRRGAWAAPRRHVLGTDNLGRDILARLLHGGRISLALAAISVLIAALVGILVGLVAGSTGERLDGLLMRAADVQLAFPVIMLAIAIVAVVGTSPGALVGVLALSGWVLYARTVRATCSPSAASSTWRPPTRWERATSGSSPATSCPTPSRRSWCSARASSRPWCCWSPG